MFEKYNEYLKNNPEGYWFKRKLYGWGWTPVKWQGWVIVLAFIVFIVWSSLDFINIQEPSNSIVYWFFAKLIICITLLIIICYKEGEKPKWQWGIPDEKKDEELK
jgi:uncharacterized membrane protein YhaH (DUF805 family)